MKNIVVYQSKTGFTKKYAEWIGKKLKCKVVSDKEAVHMSLADYDFVIYGSYIHGGRIGGLAKMKASVQSQEKSQLIIFATGASPAESKETVEAMWKGNLSEQELETIPHYYMPSGLNYEKMGFASRLMMKLFARMLSRKKNKTEEEAGCQEAIQSSYDISSITYIEPLLQCVRSK